MWMMPLHLHVNQKSDYDDDDDDDDDDDKEIILILGSECLPILTLEYHGWINYLPFWKWYIRQCLSSKKNYLSPSPWLFSS